MEIDVRKTHEFAEITVKDGGASIMETIFSRENLCTVEKLIDAAYYLTDDDEIEEALKPIFDIIEKLK